ncbi:MAG: hypothetical protein IKP66_02295, partial [Lachnospiraceae bacterium]|nr:hypothetical protein [Lachnospiraceae bacterium]
SKTLATARRWAGEGYTEVTTTNDGFTLEIIDAAQGSYSQSGKLSFWMCKITKEGLDLEVQVGINSELLCDLIKETTFDRGKCTDNLMFVHYGAVLGAVSKNTEMYNKVVASMGKKASIESNKTSKWEKGVFYESANKKSVWLGDLHMPVKLDYNPYGNRQDDTFLITIKKDDIVHIIEEYNPTLHNLIKDYTANALKPRGWHFKEVCRETLPARAKTDIQLDITNAEKDFADIAKKRLHKNALTLKQQVEERGFRIYNDYEDWYFLFASTNGVISSTNWDILNYCIDSHEHNESSYVWRPTKYSVKEGKEELDFNTLRDAMEYVKTRILKKE